MRVRSYASNHVAQQWAHWLLVPVLLTLDFNRGLKICKVGRLTVRTTTFGCHCRAQVEGMSQNRTRQNVLFDSLTKCNITMRLTALALPALAFDLISPSPYRWTWQLPVMPAPDKSSCSGHRQPRQWLVSALRVIFLALAGAFLMVVMCCGVVWISG
jgi:hypothetical protein